MERKSQILSTEEVNRKGFWVSTKGIKLEAYKANPVLLWRHEHWTLSIGRIENLRIEGTNLVGDPVFDEEDYFARSIRRKWLNGFLNAGSISLDPIKLSTDVKDSKPGQKYAAFLESEMVEYSFCNIPANRTCIALSNGSPIDLPLIQNTEMKKEHLILLGLTEGATDTQIEEAITNLKADQVNSMIELRVGKGIVTDANKEYWTKLAMSDFKTVQDMFGAAEADPDDTGKDSNTSMEKTIRLAQGDKSKVLSKKDRKDWTYLDYSKKDPAELNRIRVEDPKLYEELAAAYADAIEEDLV